MHAAAIRILDLPEADQPRLRLLRLGPGSLSEAELLALVIGQGRRGESALGLAGRLLADFGGAGRVGKTSPEELAAYPGIGDAKAAAVSAAFQLARRGALGAAPSSEGSAEDPEPLAEAAIKALDGARREQVIVFVLDAAREVKRIVKVSEGSVGHSIAPTREILNAVLRHGGKAFAVAHNHPSGDPTPSPEDVETTALIAKGAAAVGLEFIDHIVVADGAWESAGP
jgi:DNA repair protein RadC